MSPSSGPRRFAPLAGPVTAPVPAPTLRGIIFDMDGTLCQPQTYMFTEMRAALGIAASVDILHHIDGLPLDRQPAAADAIRAIERRAMLSQSPQPGLAALMSYLDARHIPKAICTRNFDLPVQNLLSKFLAGSPFSPVVTRSFRPPKPHPAGLLHIAASWGLHDDAGLPDASGLIMVGDSLDDMTAGRLAGAATVLLVNDVNLALARHQHTDLTIGRLDDLIAILDQGFKSADLVNEKI
ncbi:hypothetical protein XA68_11023 [Ophiocordyceps unilateralis]|uniref:HAD superfamily hydrolase n=1 Tax=Ophiocordyceps unilateralis TaxID=268505 RepID=A0A2A9PHA1_OPHUN|nr:hypothetical protein XA68_11023 [Ophiocordyceps unilateralis]